MADEPEAPVEEWSHWPQGLLEQHRKNLEDIRTESLELQEAKKQRMTDNGVPDEKHSI
jgi:hypothetical protein